MTEKYHFIGIAGIGMSAIAKLLLQSGKKVSGSDLSTSPIKQALKGLGAEIFDVHTPDNVSERSVVVFTSDIKEGHPELVAAKQKNCRVLHRSQMLAELFHQSKYSLAVSGTHGKTTTSSLLTEVLIAAQKDPVYALGGILCSTGTNSHFGNSDYFAIEADESDSSFLSYTPFGAILTNIDFDHMNHYVTEENLIEAFRKFANQVQSPQHLVWCGDDVRLKGLVLPGVSYGFGHDNDAILSDYRQNGWSSTFDLTWNGKIYTAIEVALPGKHYALNAAAVFILSTLVHIDEAAIRKGLSHFQGVKRRAEKIPTQANVTIIDDYAHHPTEVEAALKGIRKAVGESRLIAFFQPHRYSRLAAMVNDLPQLYRSFLSADIIVTTDLYGSGETPIPGIDGKLVYDALKAGLPERVCYSPRDQLMTWIKENVRPLDTLVFLGAGDITHVAKEAAKELSYHPLKKWRVGVAFGGPSTEHSVSLNSSKFILKNLNEDYFDIVEFGISHEGEWCTPHALQNKHFYGAPLSPDMLGQLLSCDVVFPIMHGTYGEDGIVQGFLEAMGKPYVGCDHRSSAVCMDKVLSKKIVSYHGMRVAPFAAMSEGEWHADRNHAIESILQKVNYPLIVKPSHLGSSVNISTAKNKEELEAALDLVFLADTDAIIESRLKVRDIEVAVYGRDQVYVFPPGEVYTQGNIYSYADKVGANGPKTTPKAELSAESIKEVMVLAKEAYRACGCNGMARVDFLLDENGVYWFNEINPIPGFTSISLYPEICAFNGVPPQKLIVELILHALSRHRRQKEKWMFKPPVVA